MQAEMVPAVGAEDVEVVAPMAAGDELSGSDDGVTGVETKSGSTGATVTVTDAHRNG